MDQAEKLRRLSHNQYSYNEKPQIISTKGTARVISITSGKGGVGKTNLTVNLALALANLGQKVLIIDADLGMANVDVILGCQCKYNIMHLINGSHDLFDIVVTGPRNINILAGGSGIWQLANLSESDLQKIIMQIVRFDSLVDYILIDTGAGINRNVLNFIMASDDIILVTTPEPPAITDAYAVIKAYAARNGTANLNLVVNRVINKEEAVLVVEKLSKVAYQFLHVNIQDLGYILEDQNLIKAVKKQQPVMLAYPDSICARLIEEIAYRLVYNYVKNPASNISGLKGLFHKFLSLLT